MRKLTYLSLVAICCLGLFGCPYESNVPISRPSIPVDGRLLGNWSSKDEVYNTYTVTRASETEYNIVQHNISHTSLYRGYLSELKNNLFMNIYSDSTKSYYLYRVQVDADANKFTLTPLSQDLSDHFGSMDGLRNYVEKNMNLKSFYNENDKAEFEKINQDRASVNN